MKVYISVDIEGIACLVHWDETHAGGADYQQSRKWMTAETNAAVTGAFEAGATEVVVSDSHGRNMCNLLPDELHEEVLLVRGSSRPLVQMEGLDESFDAALFVGYHSRAGSMRGVMAHTILGRAFHAIRLNNITVGETELNAAIAGHFGVPVALVCGDDVLEAQVRELLPWTERVITKWAINTHAAKCLTPKAAQKRIQSAAKRALGRLDEMKPWVLETPIRFEIELMQPIFAYVGADIPGVEQIDGRTLAFTRAGMIEIYHTFNVIKNATLSKL
jgi:D-amino peptidase